MNVMVEDLQSLGHLNNLSHFTSGHAEPLPPRKSPAAADDKSVVRKYILLKRKKNQVQISSHLLFREAFIKLTVSFLPSGGLA